MAGQVNSTKEIPDRTARQSYQGNARQKTKVLVVYRTGFLLADVLPLVAKNMGFAVRGETD